MKPYVKKYMDYFGYDGGLLNRSNRRKLRYEMFTVRKANKAMGKILFEILQQGLWASLLFWAYKKELWL